VTNREVFRGLSLFGQQLLAAGLQPHRVGRLRDLLAAPRAGGFIAPLPGFPLAMTLSPYGIAAFDRDGNGSADVLFLGDDRALLSGGGVQCWRLSGSTWSMVGNVTNLTNPIRGLTGRTQGANYVLYGDHRGDQGAAAAHRGRRRDAHRRGDHRRHGPAQHHLPRGRLRASLSAAQRDSYTVIDGSSTAVRKPSRPQPVSMATTAGPAQRSVGSSTV
jgi:hypothetical protein